MQQSIKVGAGAVARLPLNHRRHPARTTARGIGQALACLTPVEKDLPHEMRKLLHRLDAAETANRD